MKLLLDMNLPAAWCSVFEARGHEAVHWSTVGNPKASDRALMEFAAAGGFVVITYDLDFGALLAATKATKPSVVLIRAADLSVGSVELLVIATLDACADELSQGALVTVEVANRRVRALPFFR